MMSRTVKSGTYAMALADVTDLGGSFELKLTTRHTHCTPQQQQSNTEVRGQVRRHAVLYMHAN